MSDNESRALNDLLTRKSSRQKTPNTYYKQDMSDAKAAEPKPKPVKAQGAANGKTQKPKKKSIVEKTFNGANSFQQFLPTFKNTANTTEDQSESNHAYDSVEVTTPKGGRGASREVQLQSTQQRRREASVRMESESEPASDAPEGSQNQDSISMSGDDESKKSNMNNANTSNTDHMDDNSNKVGGTIYQTRKIRKKPKFADENYLDNVPPVKPVPQKRTAKGTTIKSESVSQLKKENSKNKGGDLELPTPRPLNAGTQSGIFSSTTASGAASQKTSKSTAKANSKKDKHTEQSETGFMAGQKNDLLDIFLDAVTGVQTKSDTTKSDKVIDARKPSSNASAGQSLAKQQQNLSSIAVNPTTQLDLNTSSLLTFFNQFQSSLAKGIDSPEYGLLQQQQFHQQQQPQQSLQFQSAQKSKRHYDEDGVSRIEESSTIKKKMKISKKEQAAAAAAAVAQDMNKSLNQNKQNKNQNGQSLLQQQQSLHPRVSGTVVNGTVYNYPNLQARVDYITRVEKSKDKIILHHSSLAPLEVTKVLLDSEEQSNNRLSISQLIGQIAVQQIASQQSSHKLESKQGQQNKDHSIVLAQKSPKHSTSQQQQFISQQQQLNLFANVPTTTTSGNTKCNLSNNSSDKAHMIQYALQQLQNRTSTSIQPSAIVPHVPSVNGSAQKSRSQSQEFDQLVAARKLSEQLKLTETSPNLTGVAAKQIPRKISINTIQVSTNKDSIIIPTSSSSRKISVNNIIVQEESATADALNKSNIQLNADQDNAIGLEKEVKSTPFIDTVASSAIESAISGGESKDKNEGETTEMEVENNREQEENSSSNRVEQEQELQQSQNEDEIEGDIDQDDYEMDEDEAEAEAIAAYVPPTKQ